MFEQFIGTKPVEDRHRIDVAALEEYLQLRVRGLEQFKGGQSNPTYRITAADGRQILRWTRQYQASATERIEAMDSLIAWLPANIPPETGTAVVHGDFRLDNAIFHPAEPKILAVLDWELSTLGDPLADFAYHCM